jgi:shikimate 5-dehydrogenase
MTPARPTLYFVGVTTGQSASQRIFPAWAQILGLDQAQLVGVDLPLDAPPQAYRQTIQDVKDQPAAQGALITAHKVNLWRYGYDLFDELTPEAQISQEISCIYKRDGRLIGHAVDVDAIDQAMAQFLGENYWEKKQAQVLCLGAGGAGSALALSLILRHAPSDRPKNVFLVDRQPSRLERLQRLLDSIPQAAPICELILSDSPGTNDRLMSRLLPASLVVNASGMGKDLPGSPLTWRAVFPEDGIAWDLNYRGALTFLKQAQAQAEQRRLKVVDGWDYFVIGWMAVISRVFDLSISPLQSAQMKQAAQAARRAV